MSGLYFIALLLSFAIVKCEIYLNPDYFEGDLMLTPEERANIYKDQNEYGASKKRWPTTTIPYAFADDLKSQDAARYAVYDAINEFHSKSCLKFVERTTEKDYIEFYDGQGCGARVGYQSGRNRISIDGPHCWKKGSVIHEVMHNLGFYHEQSRPDRDKYVKIMLENLSSKDMASNFQKQPASNIDSMNSPYDYLSIMHYHKDGFARRGTITIKTLDPAYQDLIGQRDGLSKQDIYQLNRMYKCGTNFPTQPPITYPPCKDENEFCHYIYKNCKLSSQRNKMIKECRRTCSFCSEPPVTEGPVVCKDKVSICKSWKRSGHCNSPNKTLKDYMKTNCVKTCDFC